MKGRAGWVVCLTLAIRASLNVFMIPPAPPCLPFCGSCTNDTSAGRWLSGAELAMACSSAPISFVLSAKVCFRAPVEHAAVSLWLLDVAGASAGRG